MDKIKQNNKLIAIFFLKTLDNVYYRLPISIIRHTSYGFVNLGNEHKLKFNTSWDWLMPLLGKIESLNYKITISSDCTTISNKSTIIIEAQHKGDDKLNNTYKSVLQFINKYNKKNKI
jgi:hypothetical protein